MSAYVIIGNGAAAAGCVEGIRKVDKEGKITIVSKEARPVYCRPLISYYLQGKASINHMGYRPERFYADNGCEVLYGETAEAIDTENKTVRLSGGSTLCYTSLCVAAGSTPFTPPFEGLDKVKSRFSFMTLDDALALEDALFPEARVLIVGAGLIGLKCAEGIFQRVKSVTVCDLADRVLSSILTPESAPLVQAHLEKTGVHLLLQDSVTRFEANSAFMKSGKTIDFDILVTAVGVRANTALVAQAGGNVNRGILVDDHMRTSLTGIYAAGDCAEGYDITFGKPRVLALLPNACMQGLTAGKNMAGADAAFAKGAPMNSIGLFGMHIMTAGSYTGEVLASAGEGWRKEFYVRDGLLKGYILIGKVERGGIYTSLIREETPLDSLDFRLLTENASFIAFSSENRRKKFGGVV